MRQPLMSDRLRLLLDQSRTISPGALLAEKRTALGLSIDDVASQLLLSRSQVRGLESDSATAFYSQRFFERATAKYVTFLDCRRATNQLTETTQAPTNRGGATIDAHVTLRMELASSPSEGAESAT